MMDEHFAVDWLAARESADHAARSEVLLDRLRGWFGQRALLRIVDLGAGTGSNARYLAPRLALPQHWTLVDHDPDLLGRVSIPTGLASVTTSTVCADLKRWQLADETPDLVTASALLDLVSGSWLDRVVADCARHRAAALMALTYDGGVTWSVPDPEDGQVRDAVNAHQVRKTALGSALGPQATEAAATRFQAAGYRVWIEPSPWQLHAEDLFLAEPLVAGWVAAAAEQLPAAETDIRAWGQRRLDDLRNGRTCLTVFHLDLLALPGEAR